MKQNKKIIFRNDRGFTLVEMIAVLVIIGILAVIVASKISGNNADLSAIASSFKTHIRYAQSKAMLSDTNVWGIRMDTGTDDYWLFQSNIGDISAWANRILPPGGDGPASFNSDRIRTSLMDIDLNQVSVGGSSKTRLALAFNDMGVPFWLEGADVTFLDPLSDTTGLTQLTTDITITLQDNAGNTKTITISSETGFVQ